MKITISWIEFSAENGDNSSVKMQYNLYPEQSRIVVDFLDQDGNPVEVCLPDRNEIRGCGVLRGQVDLVRQVDRQ